MRALRLDLHRRATRRGLAGVLALSLGLTSIAAAVVWDTQLSERSARMEESLRETGTRAEPVAGKGGRAPDADGAHQLKLAGSMARRLTVPWNDLFLNVESAAVTDVSLLGVEADMERRRVKISGEARNLEAVVGYLRSLDAVPSLREVYLQSHEVQVQDPQRPVRFVLTAGWKDAR